MYYYHGSATKFIKFDLSKFGTGVSAARNDDLRNKYPVIHLTPRKGTAINFIKQLGIKKGYVYTVLVPGHEEIPYSEGMANIQHRGVDALQILDIEEIIFDEINNTWHYKDSDFD